MSMCHNQEPSTISASSVRWLNRRINPEMRLLTLSELESQLRDIPQFWTDDIDDAYREGFEEGFDYCIERFEEMYRRRGFVRIREIANILWNWSEMVLQKWRYKGSGKFKDVLAFVPHPQHSQNELWGQIRERIIRRDKRCTRCGDVMHLEVDHIVEVQDGGLPTDGNLRTLCRVCHKGKEIWKASASGKTGLSREQQGEPNQ